MILSFILNTDDDFYFLTLGNSCKRLVEVYNGNYLCYPNDYMNNYFIVKDEADAINWLVNNEVPDTIYLSEGQHYVDLD